MFQALSITPSSPSLVFCSILSLSIAHGFLLGGLGVGFLPLLLLSKLLGNPVKSSEEVNHMHHYQRKISMHFVGQHLGQPRRCL